MEKIRKLEAGGDLDVLVAEKVMGWDVHFKLKPGEMPDREGREHFLAPSGFVMIHDREHSTIYLPEQWSPSTNIETAFEVVAKIGTGLVLHWVPNGRILDSLHEHALSDAGRTAYSGTGPWLAGLSGLPMTRAETAPLAICRMALIAAAHESVKR